MPNPFSFFESFNLVGQIPIFSKLNWLERKTVASRAAIVEYKKGDLLRRQNDPPDNLYCIISGRIEAYTEDEQGRKTTVEFLHRGMYFGIISLLTGEGHSLSFRAASLVYQGTEVALFFFFHAEGPAHQGSAVVLFLLFQAEGRRLPTAGLAH